MLGKSWGGGWVGVGMMTFLALAHMVDANQVFAWAYRRHIGHPPMTYLMSLTEVW